MSVSIRQRIHNWLLSIVVYVNYKRIRNLARTVFLSLFGLKRLYHKLSFGVRAHTLRFLVERNSKSKNRSKNVWYFWPSLVNYCPSKHVGDHVLQEFYTLFLNRFRTYKLLYQGGLRQIKKTCHKVPLQVNLALLSNSLIFLRSFASFSALVSLLTLFLPFLLPG